MRRFFALLFPLLAGCASTSAPDLILANGKVFTADAAHPSAQAIAIRGDRITSVGTDAEVRALAGRHTRVIDLAGRVVVPGINDAHVHQPFGSPMEIVDLRPNATARQILAAVAESARRVAPGKWIRASYSFAVADDPALTREALDAISPSNPVMLAGDTGHADLLNSFALRTLAIGDRDPDPPGGRYGRRDGVLNGWIYEHALWRKTVELSEAASDDWLLGSIRTFADEAVRYGITSVQSMPSIGAERIARLTTQMKVPIRWRWMELRIASVNEDPHMPMKYILDGTPIERGAALRIEYADRPGERGSMDYTDEEIHRMLVVAARGEQPLLLHVSGDLPLEKVFAEMKSINVDWPARRVRIEHGDFISQFLEDARRFGVVVVQNPAHMMAPDIMEARFGERPDLQFLRSILENDIPLALGSDGPLNPWLNVMFATMHLNNPNEAITREQAVVAYTRGSAYAEFAEKDKGTIAPGKLADLAVLSQDVFTVAASDLPKTLSVMTIVGGKIVWEQR